MTRFLRSLLFETTPCGPVVWAAVAEFRLSVATVAGRLPARRAPRIDVTRLSRVE
jgi:hypothetical protein